MKKILLSVLALVGFSSAFSQVEVGLQFTPTISTTRFEPKTEDFTFDSYKSGLRFTAGPFVDIFLTKSIAVNAGLSFSAKRTGISLTDTLGTVNYQSNNQYVQTPIGIKVFTQEITTGLKMFVNLGTTLDFKVGERVFEDDKLVVSPPENHTRFFDSSINITIGAEYKLGDHNKAFAGFTYNRGLVNVLANYNDRLNNDNLKVNSDLYGLMIGYKF